MIHREIKKSQLYSSYYILAFFVFITVLGSLYLNHRILDNYQKAIEVNQQWANRLDKIARLSLLAGSVNTSGNDVFDSRDTMAERTRMFDAREKFYILFQELKNEISAHVPAGEFAQIMPDFETIDKSMRDMLTEAEQIFSSFVLHRSPQASHPMVKMDRKYIALNKGVEALREHVGHLQSIQLKEQNLNAVRLSQFEHLVAIAILFMVMCVTLYGRKLSQSLVRITEEKEKYFSDLGSYKTALDEHSLVSITDLKGNIIYVNDKFCRVSKFSKEELLGVNHRIVNSGYHPKAFWQNMWKTIAAGNVWQAEVKNRAKDGTLYWVDSTIIPFKDPQGKITQYFSIRTDITEKMQQKEELIRAKEDAELANLSKSQFLANMSHEIRTPMNAVLGFCDLLNKTPLNDKQRSFLNVILSSGGMLLTIINDILDFSKYQSGKIKLEAIDFDLDYLLSDAFRLLQSKVAEKDISISIRIAPDVPRHLKGDPTRIKQIVINLLGNAFKFTQRGEVGVRVDLKESWQTRGEYMLEFKIKDTGIGIPQDKIGSLFQMFQQADQSTTRKYGGTGLGLVICKTLVEIMGGDIRIESQEGKGTQFVFTLVLQKADESSFDIQPLSPEELKGRRVFVVDDSQSERELLARYLEDAGMNVVGAVDSVPRALQVLDEKIINSLSPELIVTDVVMPGLDGHAFIEKLRAGDKTKEIKVLAVSSDVHVGISAQLQKEGFDGFLPKPFTPRELIGVIATMLGAGRDHPKGDIITRHKAQENKLNNCHLLVVEDVEANQLLIKAYIEVLGCTAEYASNGQEAIDHLKRNGMYTLCLMDMQMPVMDGVTATRFIRQEISRSLPIIALTAGVLKEDEQRCRAAGMDDFLTKPFDLDKFREILLKYSLK